MKAYVMDAFSNRIFSGNQAGVVPVVSFPDDNTMQAIAAEFKHSETVFVKSETDGSFSLRFFTPSGEVPLCGHATVAAFSLLYSLGMISDGRVMANTESGALSIDVDEGTVWTDMASPASPEHISAEDVKALLSAYALPHEALSDELEPAIASCGLRDILLPVSNRTALIAAKQDEQAVSEITKRLNCIGVHMFCLGDNEYAAYCSNFAPLIGIPEECATGTSNAALTHYLSMNGLVRPGEEYSFLQGEHMSRPSVIKSKLILYNGKTIVRIGGKAVMSMECDIKID